MGLCKKPIALILEEEYIDYSNLLDADGDKIGTRENFNDALIDVSYHLGLYVGRNYNDIASLFMSIDYYKAIRFCCDFDMDDCDRELNDRLSLLLYPKELESINL